MHPEEHIQRAEFLALDVENELPHNQTMVRMEEARLKLQLADLHLKLAEARSDPSPPTPKFMVGDFVVHKSGLYPPREVIDVRGGKLLLTGPGVEMSARGENYRRA